MSNQSLLCLLTLLLVSGYCGSFNATITCETCSVTCGFSKCYKISSDIWSSQTCGDDNCDLPSSLTVKFDRCDYDLLGITCGTGICYYPNTTGCVKTDVSKTISDYLVAGTWLQTSCANCLSSSSSCTKCSSTQIQGDPNVHQKCIGNGCNGAQTINITTTACAGGKGPQGNTCQNCYQVTNNPSNPLGFCTNQNARYASLDFNTYAKVRTIWERMYGIISFIALFALLVAFN